MKKNVFALSVAAALAVLAGSASAQSIVATAVPAVPGVGSPNVAAQPATNATDFVVNAGGVGHIQLIPYYTVQNSNNTLLNVVNTDTTNGKAVKVRFRGARNSDDVFDFYLLLSPGDVWRSRVYKDEAGNTRLDLNGDTTCTYPSNSVVESTSFPVGRVFENKVEETREGYIELLTAADIPPAIVNPLANAVGQFPTIANPLYTAIKHKSGVAPCTESAISASFDTVLTADTYGPKGFVAPSTGLIANWAVMNVETGSTASGNGTALQAVAAGEPAYGAIVVAPQSANAVTNATDFSADPLFATYGNYTPVRAAQYDFPDLSTPYLVDAGNLVTPADQANHVSGALAVSQIINEFTTGEAGFKTDWVFSLPTRRYGVAIDYSATRENGRDQVVYNPDSVYFDESNTDVTVDAATGAPSVKIELAGTYWDKEENTKTSGSGAVISPGVPGAAPYISGEVNVFTFNGNAPESILGGTIAYNNIAPSSDVGAIESGWATFSLPVPAVATGVTPVTGLPVIGYATMTAGNGINLTYPHRYK